MHRFLSARGSVAAAEAVPSVNGAPSGADPVAPVEGRVSAGALAGVPVVNAHGDELGRIADLVIEMEKGCVVEVIVAVGGLLGIGGRHVGVAWNSLAYDVARARMQLDTEAHALEASPAVEAR